jgi:hypothetical protein
MYSRRHYNWDVETKLQRFTKQKHFGGGCFSEYRKDGLYGIIALHGDSFAWLIYYFRL